MPWSLYKHIQSNSTYNSVCISEYEKIIFRKNLIKSIKHESNQSKCQEYEVSLIDIDIQQQNTCLDIVEEDEIKESHTLIDLLD